MPARHIMSPSARAVCRRAPAPVPALSNQVARRLDKRLGGLAQKLGLTYTRYADDLTFSGADEVNGFVGLCHGASPAHRPGGGVRGQREEEPRPAAQRAQCVTGLVVNDEPGVPRTTVRRLRAILHRARIEGLDAQNREGRPNFRAWLTGMIAYVGMVRPEVGAKLRQQLQALADSR